MKILSASTSRGHHKEIKPLERLFGIITKIDAAESQQKERNIILPVSICHQQHL